VIHERAEALAASLLYEGYALYPYTPAAVKNATPTPFGIVYPPAYAAPLASTHDRLRMQCVVAAAPDAPIEAAALFLQASGPRHQAAERRIEVGPRPIGELVAAPLEEAFAFEPGEGDATGGPSEAGSAVVTGRVVIRAEPLATRAALVTVEVENTTPVPEAELEAMDRPAALRRSLLSTQVLAGLDGEGVFVSPLERDGRLGAAVATCVNVNTWPVLASPDDRAILGAPIILPDHPEVAPQSKVDMFDNTEIEEALLLHVKTLSDAEREAIAEQDPAVREMVASADSASAEDVMELHGVMKPTQVDPEFPSWSEPRDEAGAATRPARRPPTGADDVPGEERVVVDGVPFERGGKVTLRPGEGGDPYDMMLAGRRATVERIYLDYDGKAYLGVTVDDDPMREVLSESGRYLFFFADELEPA
jgi:hypothetical protein